MSDFRRRAVTALNRFAAPVIFDPALMRRFGTLAGALQIGNHRHV